MWLAFCCRKTAHPSNAEHDSICHTSVSLFQSSASTILFSNEPHCFDDVMGAGSASLGPCLASKTALPWFASLSILLSVENSNGIHSQVLLISLAQTQFSGYWKYERLSSGKAHSYSFIPVCFLLLRKVKHKIVASGRFYWCCHSAGLSLNGPARHRPRAIVPGVVVPKSAITQRMVSCPLVRRP